MGTGFRLDLDAVRLMKAIVGMDVPNDRRKTAEKLPNFADGAARLRFGTFTLDFERGALLDGDDEVSLRPKTFAFLRYLAANPGRLVSKDELFAAVWPDVVVTDDSIVQCVTELRRALQDDDQQLIKTVQRRGYRFDGTLIIAVPLDAVSKPMTEDRERAAGRRRVLNAGGRSILGAFVTVLLLITVTTAFWWVTESRDAAVTAPPLSIVVLPFVNLSDDPDQAFLAEGVSNDLTMELSRLPGIFVIAAATARTFKGKAFDARRIGRDLNVRYLLEGNVRRAGNKVRINVELIDAETTASVWAERFERQREEIAAWQDEIIGRIAIALSYRLTWLESERGLRQRRDNPEVSDLTMRGWSLVYAAKKPDNYHTARTLFREAVERDSRAVNAIAGIGWTSAVLVLDGWSTDPAADMAAAESAVQKTLAVDPNQIIAHHVRGFLLRLQRRSSAAHDAFRTVIALNPNFAPGYAQLGAIEIELGRPEATRPAVEYAIRLSPRDPSLGPWLAFVGIAELHLGRYQEAIVWLSRAIDTETPVARHQAYLVSALALAGRLPEARVALANFRAKQPAATITRLRAMARSTDAGFLAQQERLFEGLRIAGLPD